MKILMGVPAPGLKGGPPTHLPFLVEYFERKEAFQIRTFYFGSKTNTNRYLINKIFNTTKVIFQFIRLIIIYNPDIIHLNSSFDKKSILRDLPFSIISKLFSKPLLFKVHGSHYELLFTKKKLLLSMIKLYFWGASKVGVLSEFEKKEFISQFGNSSKLIVVKNIVSEINQELLKPNSINNPNKKFDALFVSRIEKGKGLEDLLNAVPHLLKSYSQFKLGIAGSGNRMNACKKIADDLNIQQNIKWLGYIMDQQLNQAFNESKIFVFTSHFPEGMPMSMIEALLHGIPVITTKNRFALSYFQENENVIFVERNNPIELSKKIICLLNDQAAQEKMRMNNFHFLSQFTQDKVGEEFANIYVQMKNKKN